MKETSRACSNRKVDLDRTYPEVSFSLPKIERPSFDWLRTEQACPSPVCKHIANDLPLLSFVTLPAITKKTSFLSITWVRLQTRDIFSQVM